MLFWVAYAVIPIVSTALTVVMIITANKPEMRVIALFLLVSVFGNGLWILLEIRPSFFGGMVPVWLDEVAMLNVVGKRMDQNEIRRKVKLTDEEFDKLADPLMDEMGLPVESESDMRLAKEYLQIQRQNYFDIDRKETDGPVRIGSSMLLGEDVYSVAFIY